jgi:hypothetical protein
VKTPDDYSVQVVEDLADYVDDFDAIVVAGDHHGIAIGAIIAASTGKPLMIVGPEAHTCVVSHITTIGECLPSMRYLYCDDFDVFGASRAKTFAYMNQSGKAPIVAAYMATERKYEVIG